MPEPNGDNGATSVAQKKALRGLKAFNLFPIISNTAEAYEVGDKIALIGAQRLTKSTQSQDYTIYADDEVYDSGEDFQYVDLQLQVAELDIETESQLSGGTWDETNQVASSSTADVAPEYAASYAALYKGGYRLFKHPVAKLMSITVDHETKGDSQNIAPYTLNIRVFARKIDNVHKQVKDVVLADLGESESPFEWIEAFDTLPASSGT